MIGRLGSDAANDDDDDEDTTPLSQEERKGLIPTHIALRRELNELEQVNIGVADAWAFSRRHRVLGEPFLRSLHKRMFNRVWRWAGTYRTTEKNIGVSPHRIETDLHGALKEIRYWNEHKTWERDELALRLHHRLVAVHPFPNGNGRWSRLMGDVFVWQLGGARFSWGSASLQSPGETRDSYIKALKAADAYDLQKLIEFARS